MPTYNQLVRKGRKKLQYKSTSPAMQKGLNTLRNVETDLSSSQKRGVCTAVELLHRKNQTRHYAKSHV